MPDRVLDRLVEFDPRSKDYPVRPLLAAAKRTPRSYTWRHVQLDQGSEGACTGFSATMEAAARPKAFFGDPVKAAPDVPTLTQTAREVYYRARQIDQWPGEDYEGSSVIAATKAGQERGWWGEYRWATGFGVEGAAEDIILSIGYFGPVMMGSYWYSGMWTPDSEGFLKVEGNIAGGHAYLLTAYSRKRDSVYTPNSWGGEGAGWIKRSDLVKLLDANGECCIPVERLSPPR